MRRRGFLKRSLVGGLSLVPVHLRNGRGLLAGDERQQKGPAGVDYGLERQQPARLFDGKRFFCHARAGIVPGDGKPAVVMTMNTMHVGGSDVFKAMYVLRTDDLGRTWSDPRESEPLSPRWETIDGREVPVAASDFWPRWHSASGTLLGTGHTVVYDRTEGDRWRFSRSRPRSVIYAVYDSPSNRWSRWRRMALPNEQKFHNAGAGCTQRYDLDDGTILLPCYFYPPGENSRVAVARCTFDGKELRYREHGEELAVDDNTRGLHEPSLTRFGDTYFLTLRNDRRGYVTRSRDGLNFEPIRPWRFDDGEDLGNYNTQQHWVTHSEGLFLVYTRRGANNDHVFRHRAPLFMARVDPERLRVIRETERVLVPERGARLGNFGVTDVTDRETWVTVAEWMQPEGVQQHGSDGSVWVARIQWDRPNRLFTPGDSS